MTYLTDELRGIDAAIGDLRQRISAMEAEIAALKKSIPARRATERQKAFINDICQTLHIPFPEGYPNHITFDAASKFIEAKARFFYDAKRADARGARA